MLLDKQNAILVMASEILPILTAMIAESLVCVAEVCFAGFIPSLVRLHHDLYCMSIHDRRTDHITRVRPDADLFARRSILQCLA